RAPEARRCWPPRSSGEGHRRTPLSLIRAYASERKLLSILATPCIERRRPAQRITPIGWIESPLADLAPRDAVLGRALEPRRACGRAVSRTTVNLAAPRDSAGRVPEAHAWKRRAGGHTHDARSQPDGRKARWGRMAGRRTTP